MNAAHTIRLRGPWEYRVLRVPGDPEARRTRIDISNCEGLLHRAVGCLELTRRFNRPTGLNNKEQVDLILGPIAQLISLELNDESLGIGQAADELRYNITARLQTHNVLRMVIDTAQQQDLRFDNVRLEIHTP